MRLHNGAISRHSGSPRKFDDRLVKKRELTSVCWVGKRELLITEKSN